MIVIQLSITSWIYRLNKREFIKIKKKIAKKEEEREKYFGSAENILKY